MPQEIVLRKRERDGDKVCTTYGISEPSYKFTLDTCDNIEATIKNTSGLTISTLTLNAPTTVVSKKGNYNICIEGVGIGTLYAEWTQSGSGGGEDCCDELRQKDTELQQQITNVTNRLNNQNITGGTGISVTKYGDSYTITNTAPAGGSQDKDTVTTLVPGDGVSITDSGTGGNHVYTITASGGSGGDDVDIVSTSANLTVTMEIV